MKLFLCVVITLSGGLIGIVYANKFHKKLQYFQDLAYVFDNFRLKIAFFKDNFVTVLENCQTQFKCKTQFFKLLITGSKSGTLNENAIATYIDLDLPADEKKEIARYLFAITKICDSAHLIEAINSGNNYVQDRLNYYDNKDKIDGALVKKLGVSIGLVVSILIY